MVDPRSPVKWLGGKARHFDQILSWMPVKLSTYHEPFVGGGATFWNLWAHHHEGPEWVLSDSNPELMHLYKMIRDDVFGVITILHGHVYERSYYDKIRAQVPEDLIPAARAARFLYLNKTCFNGLYRVNKAGRFNVPFGAYVNPTICDQPNLLACRDALQGVELLQASYLTVEERAAWGHVVYFDPPYCPLSATSNFTGYTSDGFSLADHERLRDLSLRLAAKGVHVVLSQSAAPAMRELYDEVRFEVRELQAARNVNCKKEKRAPVTELLIRPRVRG
jgi:DNA adenine methylase